LAEHANHRNIAMETVDVFLARTSETPALLFSNMFTNYSMHLIQDLRLFPAVCICLESPIIAFYFYHYLESISSMYRHVFLYEGTREMITSPDTIFHKLYWPFSENNVVESENWKDRKYLTLINANKRAFPSDVPPEIRSDPWIEAELYSERLEAIKYFSGEQSFDLYGHGWDRPVHRVTDDYNEAVLKCYRGVIPPFDKLAVLSKYKFAICFDNCIFPGWVTEKIFDCLFAGCIPIYYGASDIEDYVPPDAFIDFREFDDYKSLDRFLESIDYSKAVKYLESGRKFVESSQFENHTQEYFARELIACFEECFNLASGKTV